MNPYVDSNESSQRRAFFLSKGWEQKQLNSADYAFMTKSEDSVGIEFKSFGDFLNSVFTRLPEQLHRMIEDYDIRILLVVGDLTQESLSNGSISYSNQGIWNALRTWQDRGITLELCSTEYKACQRILSLQEYYSKVVHTGGFRGTSSGLGPKVAALAACRGVGPVTAQALLDKFSTLDKVANASTEDLMTVPGVGLKMTQKIWQHFHE